MLPGVLGQNLQTFRFTNAPLQPAFIQENSPWVTQPVSLVGTGYYARGTVLAQITQANTADVQTITVSGGSGSMTFWLNTLNGPIGPFAYNISLVNLAAAIATIYGVGNIAVTGTPGSSYVLTGTGALAAGLLPLLGILNVSSGLTVTIAHTTPGALNGAFTTYLQNLVAAPTTAATVTAAGVDGTWGVGTYVVTYTYMTASGETTPSYAAVVTLGATNHIAVASLTGIPNGVVSVNVYVNHTLAFNQAVTNNATGAFSILAPSGTLIGLGTPAKNTASIVNDGSQIPQGILCTDAYADPFGNVWLGQSPQQQIAVQALTAEMLLAGYVNTANLVGLDANAVSVLGKLKWGTLSSGLLVVL